MKRITAAVLALLLLAMCSSASADLVGPIRYESNFNTMVFGRYEQDNDPDTEPEPITWIILDEQDGKRLLISRDLLDCKRFNEVYGPITWEECTLRTWLNEEFLQTAFTEEEQAAIPLTDVDNSKAQDNPDYHDTTSGNNTQDRIFLISAGEALKYFPDNESRRSVPTEYAIARGAKYDHAYQIDGRQCGWWWFRSAGPHQWRASIAYAPGTLRYTFTTRIFIGVRPMLWVDLSKLPEEAE